MGGNWSQLKRSMHPSCRPCRRRHSRWRNRVSCWRVSKSHSHQTTSPRFQESRNTIDDLHKSARWEDDASGCTLQMSRNVPECPWIPGASTAKTQKTSKNLKKKIWWNHSHTIHMPFTCHSHAIHMPFTPDQNHPLWNDLHTCWNLDEPIEPKRSKGNGFNEEGEIHHLIPTFLKI